MTSLTFKKKERANSAYNCSSNCKRLKIIITITRRTTHKMKQIKFTCFKGCINKTSIPLLSIKLQVFVIFGLVFLVRHFCKARFQVFQVGLALLSPLYFWSAIYNCAGGVIETPCISTCGLFSFSVSSIMPAVRTGR